MAGAEQSESANNATTANKDTVYFNDAKEDAFMTVEDPILNNFGFYSDSNVTVISPKPTAAAMPETSSIFPSLV